MLFEVCKKDTLLTWEEAEPKLSPVPGAYFLLAVVSG